jgi:hypothetical protein
MHLPTQASSVCAAAALSSNRVEQRAGPGAHGPAWPAQEIGKQWGARPRRS